MYTINVDSSETQTKSIVQDCLDPELKQLIFELMFRLKNLSSDDFQYLQQFIEKDPELLKHKMEESFAQMFQTTIDNLQFNPIYVLLEKLLSQFNDCDFHVKIAKIIIDAIPRVLNSPRKSEIIKHLECISSIIDTSPFVIDILVFFQKEPSAMKKIKLQIEKIEALETKLNALKTQNKFISLKLEGATLMTQGLLKEEKFFLSKLNLETREKRNFIQNENFPCVIETPLLYTIHNEILFSFKEYVEKILQQEDQIKKLTEEIMKEEKVLKDTSNLLLEAQAENDRLINDIKVLSLEIKSRFKAFEVFYVFNNIRKTIDYTNIKEVICDSPSKKQKFKR